MSRTIDLSQAYQLIPNLEQVTLKLRADLNGTFYSQVIPDAKRLVQANSEAEASDAIYVRQKLSFWLPTAELLTTLPNGHGGIPRPGDQIVDQYNVMWTIQDVGNPAINVWWKCRCVRVILEDLNQRLTIKFPFPPNSTDAYASALTPQAASNANDVNIVCAIQEVLDASVEYQGIDAFMRYFQIWTYSEDYMPKGTILVQDDGTQYEVVRVSDKKRIDSLMMIEAVIQP